MRLISVLLAFTMASSAAFAGNAGPLAAGMPAGVKKAQMEDSTVTWVVLGVAAVTAIAVGVSGGNGMPASGGSSTTTTTTTTTTTV